MHLHIEMIETLLQFELQFTFLDTGYIFPSFQKQKVHGANIIKHLKMIS